MRSQVHRVLLVRPWGDAHPGNGCCSGDPRHGIAVDPPADSPVEHVYSTRVVAESYRRLRSDLPDVDVQLVSSSNTVYVVPTVLRTVGRGEGVLAALQRVNRATRPGSVVVDGDYVGDIVDLGPGGVVNAVRARLA